MFTFALPRRFATRASAPGLLERRISRTSRSPLTRIFALFSARFAFPGSLGTTRMMPLPPAVAAESAWMLTPAFPSASASAASCPGLFGMLTVSSFAMFSLSPYVESRWVYHRRPSGTLPRHDGSRGHGGRRPSDRRSPRDPRLVLLRLGELRVSDDRRHRVPRPLPHERDEERRRRG